MRPLMRHEVDQVLLDVDPGLAAILHQRPGHYSRISRLEKLEREVVTLSAEERAHFREWYEQYDAAEWDRALEADVAAGKLDRLAEAALADHRTGRSRAL